MSILTDAAGLSARMIWGIVILVTVYACIWFGLDVGPALALSAVVFYFEMELHRLGWAIGQALGKIDRGPEPAEFLGDISVALLALVAAAIGAFLGVWLRQAF